MEDYYFDVTTFGHGKYGEDLKSRWNVRQSGHSLEDASRKIEKRFKNIFDFCVR